MGIFSRASPTEAILLDTMQRISAELAAIQVALGHNTLGAATHSDDGTCKVHNVAATVALPHTIDTHGHAAHFSLYELALPYFHIIIDSLNIVGVVVMFVTVLAVLPTMLREVLPSMFANADEDFKHSHGHRHGLHVRITLSRGIMLGLDFMVGADVIETLCGNADVVKIMCIVAIRSFLGWERGKEMAHMQHEVDHWKKAQTALLSTIGGGKPFYEMSKEELVSKTEECFAKFDADGSGAIDQDELMEAMSNMGVTLSGAEIKKMMGGKDMTFEKFHDVIAKMAGGIHSNPH